MDNGTNTRERDKARVRSAVYRMLAHALRYPDEPWLPVFCDTHRWSGLLESAARLDGELTDLLLGVRDRLIKSVPAGTEGSSGALLEMRAAHIRLFGHTVRGRCPPYELEYGRRDIVQQAPQLADIAGFYAAFGMQLADDTHERADHVAVECEFLSVLAEKEAYALEANDVEARDVVRAAERSFLADHLGRWLPSLARRVQGAEPDGAYGALARLAGWFVASECRRHHVAAGPVYLELSSADVAAEASIDCGGGASLPGPQKDSLVQLGFDGAGGPRRAGGGHAG